ncbi:hypothetical protein F5B17DRAFT_262664 [Nemania serpens]|nr:hypothetical protein F5B17DRAFT_262664 [Nemania serpens]
MFAWHRDAAVLYAFLSSALDRVSTANTKAAFAKADGLLGGGHCKNIAPMEVRILSHSWTSMGTKKSLGLLLANTAGINVSNLLQEHAIELAGVARQMPWTANCEATRSEGGLYCMMRTSPRRQACVIQQG